MNRRGRPAWVALAIGSIAVAVLSVPGRSFAAAEAIPATPVGGVAVEPSAEPLRLAGCVVTPRAPETVDWLVRAMAGFRCDAAAARRNVTVELWQLDGNGFWEPVAATDETFATSPGLGSTPHPPAWRRSIPLGPDEISCRATRDGALHRYRTYVAAVGPRGEPLLHAGPEALLPADCLAGMAVEDAVLLDIPPDSSRRERLPPRDALRAEPVCPAFLLSPRPVSAADCRAGRDAATPTP